MWGVLLSICRGGRFATPAGLPCFTGLYCIAFLIYCSFQSNLLALFSFFGGGIVRAGSYNTISKIRCYVLYSVLLICASHAPPLATTPRAVRRGHRRADRSWATFRRSSSRGSWHPRCTATRRRALVHRALLDPCARRCAGPDGAAQCCPAMRLR